MHVLLLSFVHKMNDTFFCGRCILTQLRRKLRRAPASATSGATEKSALDFRSHQVSALSPCLFFSAWQVPSTMATVNLKMSSLSPGVQERIQPWTGVHFAWSSVKYTAKLPPSSPILRVCEPGFLLTRHFYVRASVFKGAAAPPLACESC